MGSCRKGFWKNCNGKCRFCLPSPTSWQCWNPGWTTRANWSLLTPCPASHSSSSESDGCCATCARWGVFLCGTETFPLSNPWAKARRDTDCVLRAMTPSAGGKLHSDFLFLCFFGLTTDLKVFYISKRKQMISAACRAPPGGHLQNGTFEVALKDLLSSVVWTPLKLNHKKTSSYDFFSSHY